jgi:hypothetical protein
MPPHLPIPTKSRLHQRDYSTSFSAAGAIGIVIGVFLLLIAFCCCMRAHSRNKHSHTTTSIPRSAALRVAPPPPLVGIEILDPPPAYVALTTLKPAYKAGSPEFHEV